jgi:hypothetical protein
MAVPARFQNATSAANASATCSVHRDFDSVKIEL